MMLVIYSPGLRCRRLAKPSRPLGESVGGAVRAGMASECERLVLAYMKVTDPAPFGTADPFGMVKILAPSPTHPPMGHRARARRKFGGCDALCWRLWCT